MKYLFVLLMVVALPLTAQDTSTVSVPRSTLTKQQQAIVETKSNTYIGMGHEVGVAVNEALGAVTEQAGKFGETKVGKLTMGIVVWKILGHDILGFIWGFLTLLIGTPILIWSYRKYFERRVLVKDGPNKEKEWSIIKMSGDYDSARFLHALAFLMLLGISSCNALHFI
jgi:hypothetical protein